MNSPPIGTVRIGAPPVIGTKKKRNKTKVHPLTEANVEFDEYEEKRPVPASGGEKTIAWLSMSITPGRLDGYEDMLVQCGRGEEAKDDEEETPRLPEIRVEEE
ncbi:hypothetical protein V7S43_007285 [Phytophthora oleae]|uniref:PiggyBac transposable element-derived protein domain-containing protein n=1 Tax=Phytophthora oleae TaxID=2107226 RepID=A0ABD3FPG1_9STRA